MIGIYFFVGNKSTGRGKCFLIIFFYEKQAYNIAQASIEFEDSKVLID